MLVLATGKIHLLFSGAYLTFSEWLMRFALERRIHSARLLNWAQGRNEFRVPNRVRCAGSVEETDLGDALHMILLAEFINPGHPGRKDLVRRVLQAFGLASAIQENDVVRMADAFRARINDLFHPIAVLAETPFEITNAAGQRCRGFIDLMLETEKGWIVVDHKSFRGGTREWTPKALSYSGQLSIYSQALRNTGREFAGAWIHFACGGGMVELLLPAAVNG
jgi:ATP-dependent helicase/nuclease subunit A